MRQVGAYKVYHSLIWARRWSAIRPSLTKSRKSAPKTLSGPSAEKLVGLIVAPCVYRKGDWLVRKIWSCFQPTHLPMMIALKKEFDYFSNLFLSEQGKLVSNWIGWERSPSPIRNVWLSCLHLILNLNKFIFFIFANLLDGYSRAIEPRVLLRCSFFN